VNKIELIITECKRQGVVSIPQIAYVLATVEWETNKTFQPVVESYWLKNPDQYNKINHPNYYPYYGRGYVQLTWRRNYKFFSDLLKKDLVRYPELVLDPEIAAFILVYGMKNGSFTGKKLDHYINDGGSDYRSARRIINGIDKHNEIAKIAKSWEIKLNV
jgi:predicted chitinase